MPPDVDTSTYLRDESSWCMECGQEKLGWSYVDAPSIPRDPATYSPLEQMLHEAYKPRIEHQLRQDIEFLKALT